MSWNYRVFRGTDKTGHSFYEMRGAYYNDAGVMVGWTADACGPMGETFDELINDLAWMLAGLTKPVLDADTGAEVEPARLLEDDLQKMLDAMPEGGPLRIQPVSKP